MSEGFDSHSALLDCFLTRRREIFEHIESRLLNVRGKDTARSRNRALFDRLFGDCFFGLPGLPRDAAPLKGRLAEEHVRSGFEPVTLKDLAHELDPLELIVRAYRHWDEHRWPGASGRLTYAQTLFAVFMLRQVEYLSLRIWDDGTDRAGDRFHDVQALLDRLNAGASPGAFVRDARWLIHTAQGPLTSQLRPYFTIAGRIAESFTASFRLELHKTGARLAGGHLRSQLRYRMWETSRAADAPDILAVTRNSNSMDVALLVRDLVGLLDAYARAFREEDVETRLDLADAILQGLSADPELLVTRLDLLGPCTVIEDLFVEQDPAGRARRTPMGHAHAACVERYIDLIGECSARLREDMSRCVPSLGVYSPFGITYGFCADMLSNMALDTLVSQPALDLSLEDMFVSRRRLDEKRARSNGWKQLPIRPGEREHFDHSVDWANDTLSRVAAALERRAQRTSALNASDQPDGRLFILAASQPAVAPAGDPVPAGVVSAQEHCLTSDLGRALAGAETGVPRKHMLSDRNEARFLASAECDGEWFGVSKVLLSLITSQGKDAVITDVPAAVVEVLRVTCPALVSDRRAAEAAASSALGAAGLQAGRRAPT